MKKLQPALYSLAYDVRRELDKLPELKTSIYGRLVDAGCDPGVADSVVHEIADWGSEIEGFLFNRVETVPDAIDRQVEVFEDYLSAEADKCRDSLRRILYGHKPKRPLKGRKKRASSRA